MARPLLSVLRTKTFHCQSFSALSSFTGHVVGRYDNSCFRYDRQGQQWQQKRQVIASLHRSFTDSVTLSPASSHDKDGTIIGNEATPTGSSSINPVYIPDRLVSILQDPDLIHKIPLQDVRNFCIIAHIDHGKSSITSRLLELTGNLGPESQKEALRAASGNNFSKDKDVSYKSTTKQSSYRRTSPKVMPAEKEQIELLDTLSVERERGITVKASTATMVYPHPSAVGPEGVLLINCIDCPGHSDFSSEVARSLQFAQGAVLLLDASQGIQAQTWTVHETAKSMTNPPELILALTKIDLDAARPIDVALTVSEWLSVEDPESIVLTSARSRIGIADLLDAVCQRVPPPQPLPDDNEKGENQHLRAKVVDSWYDSRGVNCIVQILSGSLNEGDRIAIASETENIAKTAQSYAVQEIGLVLPKTLRTGKLHRGQMGYVRFGLKDPRQADPGTILIFHRDVGSDILLPGQNTSTSDSSITSVLYASVHPEEEDGFEELCDAVERLALNDKGLEVARTADLGANSSESGGPFLGPGIRVGFQGLLHVEVFRQRLEDEFGIEAVVTPPKVPYHVTLLPSKQNNLTEPRTCIVEDLEDWPEYGTKFKVEEPMVKVTIMAPVEYAGAVMDLVTKKRGINLTTKPIDENSWMFEAEMPWAEVVVNFHDMLKTSTAGYGSMNTTQADPPLREAKLSKVDILLNGDPVGPLSFVCHTPNAHAEARVVCQKLQEVLPRQQFVVVIQAKADGKIIASERIRAYRKDVLVKSGKMVGGGDISRKKKLLEKQKKGKKRAQQTGKVTLSQAAFNSVISRQ
ncbi:elongation factor Tu GTP binding domain containing protein [Nitzschia inconspicua]|uniref:Translation factor GUF1 homolog, mitochondrial n=1 Tax=Nitzschia inconspicua TaxID=303405 RepID=A0A9K3K564_9STRA|nr:elongation factor Tu GTP binding domain containing protein [Nitzschia inconspicua]KAG7367473.1 elongation factor Tu GTP binding domain containing protein [Nitzschia inconspicua]